MVETSSQAQNSNEIYIYIYIYIYIIFIFSCKSGAFLGVAVLTAQGAYCVDSGCLDSNGKQNLPASKYDVFEISFIPVVNKCN